MTGPTPRTRIGAAALALLGLALAPEGRAQMGSPVVFGPAQPVEARVWLDRGDEPILQVGERARIYYRAVQDAYVAIFQIDTDGVTRLVFPRSPGEDHYARGGRDYRVLFPGTQYWIVNEEPGVGYFFVVASPEPFDFSGFRFSPYRRTWDLSQVGQQVYRDPYVAMDDYVAALIPDWQTASYALDFSTYHVGERYEYPRFLCYDCHGFRGYSAWNPYYAACTSFRVVIYDDPYFYPARRYRSDRVVWTQPVAPGRPRFAFKERVRGEPTGPMIQARVTPPPTGVSGPQPRRSPTGGAGGVAPSAPPDPGPTNPAVIRGRPSVPAAPPGADRGSSGTVTAPTRSVERPSGVVSPPSRNAEPAAEPAQPSRPSGLAPVDAEERLRPVLRRRPSEPERQSEPAPSEPSRGRDAESPETAPAPTTQRRPAPAPAQRPSGGGRSAPSGGQSGSNGGRAQPQPESQRPSARPRNGGGAVAPSSGGEQASPTVRGTPDGRPVIRR